MTRLHLTCFVLGLCVTRCGDAGATEPLTEAPCEDDCGVVAVSVCGENAPGFVGIGGLAPGTPMGGDLAPFGGDVMHEIGAIYVAISPDCDYWAYSPVGLDGLPDGGVYEGRLTAEQRIEVDAFLQLGAWEALGPVHGLGGVFDFAPSSYHWGQRTLAWVGVPGEGPPKLPDDFPLDLSRAHIGLYEKLASFGEAASGPMRYTLLESGLRLHPAFDTARQWPLAGPVSEAAITGPEVLSLRDRGLPPTVTRATGTEVETLRAFRALVSAENFDSLPFLPVLGPDGTRYELYLRDVASCEDPEGFPTRDPASL